jgi:hypothetical protein
VKRGGVEEEAIRRGGGSRRREEEGRERFLTRPFDPEFFFFWFESCKETQTTSYEGSYMCNTLHQKRRVKRSRSPFSELAQACLFFDDQLHSYGIPPWPPNSHPSHQVGSIRYSPSRSRHPRRRRAHRVLSGRSRCRLDEAEGGQEGRDVCRKGDHGTYHL